MSEKYFKNQAPAMLPVFDLPNHKNPDKAPYPTFQILASDKKSYYFVARGGYSAGEEFSYVYTPRHFNAHLIASYGFALEKNQAEYLTVPITNFMANMTKHQQTLC